jgi:hypothetical protein
VLIAEGVDAAWLRILVEVNAAEAPDDRRLTAARGEWSARVALHVAGDFGRARLRTCTATAADGSATYRATITNAAVSRRQCPRPREADQPLCTWRV